MLPPPSIITPAQILHPIPKPITSLEFLRAVRACTPPRFPHARVTQPRRVGLAVSGGVDSMALAFLFNELREMRPLLPIVDNSLTKITAFVIDHCLRPESANEAAAVYQELCKFRRIGPIVAKVNWKKPWGVEGDPAESRSNLESLARRARYERLGIVCWNFNIESLFLAHHEDDQYETILMRLLSGHGNRGLRGMMRRATMPECYGMHGVHESGHIDDQRSNRPSICFRPPRRVWRHLRRELFNEVDWDLYSAELRAGLHMDWHEPGYVEDDLFPATASATAKAKAAAAASAAVKSLPPIETEDAGVMIYRPLLGFSKDRLRATCEQNNVRWFEDPTNEDRTLTMRNAVRYMVRNHRLPEALRKDSILRLSAHCDARMKAQEWEADRWIKHRVVADFKPNVGTLLVTLPDMAVRRVKRRSSWKRRRELRLAQRRTVAALVVRRLLTFVSPEKHHAQVSSLQSVVARLFPALAEAETPHLGAVARKAFNQASVLFLPVPSHPNKWYLVREPYPSLHPLPEVTFITASGERNLRFPQFPPVPPPACLWAKKEDVAGTMPPEAERMSHGEWLRSLQEQPLPAPRAFGRQTWLLWQRCQLWDGRFWIRVKGKVRSVFRVAPFLPQHAKAFRQGLGGGNDNDNNDARLRLEALLKHLAPGKVRYTLPALYAVNRDEETDEEILRMLALPTLGIQLPGLEKWVKFETRYKKVPWELLEMLGDEKNKSSWVGGGGGDGGMRRNIRRSIAARRPRALPLRAWRRTRRSESGQPVRAQVSRSNRYRCARAKMETYV